MIVSLHADFRKIWEPEFKHELRLHYVGVSLLQKDISDKNGVEYLEEALKSELPSSVMYSYLVMHYWDDEENLKRVCNRATHVLSKFNEAFADYSISRFPEYKEDILFALETDTILVNEVFEFKPHRLSSFFNKI